MNYLLQESSIHVFPMVQSTYECTEDNLWSNQKYRNKLAPFISNNVPTAFICKIFRNNPIFLFCFVIITNCSAINDFTTSQHVLSRCVNSEVKRTCDVEPSYQFKICISRPLLLSAAHRGIYERLNGNVCLFASLWYQLAFLSGKQRIKKIVSQIL